MQKKFHIPAIALALALGACAAQNVNNTGYFSRQSLQADIDLAKQKLAAFITKVKTNAPIYEAEAKAALGIACAVAPLVQQEAGAVPAAFMKPPVVVVQTAAKVQDGAVVVQKGCAAYNGVANSSTPPTSSETVNAAIGAVNGFQAIVNALKDLKLKAKVN